MTCIVGLEHEGKVYIGGDSAGVGNNYQIHIRSDEKVFIRKGSTKHDSDNVHDIVMGFTESFRMGQLLRYSLSIPSHNESKSDMEYLVIDFISAVRECFKEGGYGSEDENGSVVGGTFLLGYKGKLYVIYEDFQVAHVADGFSAIGCGEELALGSMHTTGNLAHFTMMPKDRIKVALDAACKFSAGVHEPYTILSV